MYTDTFKGRGCAKCPVNQWACDAQYLSCRCDALRKQVGFDFNESTEECVICKGIGGMSGIVTIDCGDEHYKHESFNFRFCPICGRKILE